jgi:hypothetical protein
MTLQARSAKERLSLIIGGQSSQSAQLSFKNIVLSLAMDELKKATTSYVESTITEEDLAHTFMVSFRLDESIGPTIHAVEQIDLSDDSQYRLLTQISILYSVALGQGQGYHEGLFGPLPYGADLRSIIFTCSMQDPTANRQKYKKQAYILFCLVFPPKMVPFFYDREKLNRIFEVHTKSINKVSDITTGFLTNLRQTILMEFQHDFRSEEFDDTGISDEL